MCKLIRAALAGLSVAVAGATNSQAAEHVDPAIACEVAGYDVIIYNPRTGPIAAGTKVQWSVPFDRAQGNHTLAVVLEPGKAVFLVGALGSYLDPDERCLASLG